MELRHLRYFVAVANALNFTKAAAKLRIAQPALSRQVQDLEDEIGVDLMKRSPRGVTLTAEGRLFLEHALDVLAMVDASVKKVQALARGEFGELHVGYSPSPTIEILPPALAAFQKAVPGVSLHLHDLSGNDLAEGLRTGHLELAIMQCPMEENGTGLAFEPLRSYPMCVAVNPHHPLARLKVVPMAKLQSEKLVVFRRSDYADYHHRLDLIFSNASLRPRFAVECDGTSSLITEVEAGRGVAILPQVFSQIAGRRLRFRLLSPAPIPLHVGIARSLKGDVTPAGEKFCEFLREHR
jgi:DNA-binding transcriptional LysR family regulator